ncbi:DUF4350 domain-containing protein [Salinigranum salinum]|uniref:DUF4350 domain-containing protein n=1 Tax=Salinigranum salinum TaxID=1364937 RepID=UPI001260DAA3|nr:DUF4350 domain-containing protein [Salinigranum salinum]
MTPNELGVALAKRLAVAAVVVVLIVATAFAIPAATDSSTEREPLDTPEYEVESLATTPIPAEGEIEADASVGNRAGVVVIDESHSNRVSRADLAPLVRELTRIGYTVRFYDGDQSLDQELSNVNAFLVVDPGQEFDRDEIDNVREFTNEGGHLLMIGEPNRKRISASLFGTSISEQESALTTLAGRYDMSLGTAYLYNLETNGGNYKHVTARATPESGLELDSVTMFTAAPVYSRGGTVLLRTAQNTHEAGIDSSRRYPVAIHKEAENAVLVGDKTFLQSDRFNVGDNEQFMAFLVEFLISGERIPESELDGDDEEDDTDEETADGTDGTDESGDGALTNNTTTPAPETPTADLVAPSTGDATAVTSQSVDGSPAVARSVDRFAPFA